MNTISNITSFSQLTIERIKFYVYILTYLDSKTNEEVIFYVGKGQKNRVFSHFKYANKIEESSFEKENVVTDKIKLIINEKCNAYLVAIELTGKEAFKIESILIALLSRFRSSSLTTLTSGHHTFTPKTVDEIEMNYANELDLDLFCKENNISVLTLKSTWESYESTKNKDFRGVLEGVWRLNANKLNQIDYIIGVCEQRTYAIYKYGKNSFRKWKDLSNDQQEEWISVHREMGRPKSFINEELMHDEQEAGVMKLIPLVLPLSQKNSPKDSLEIKDELAIKLFNKTIKNQQSRNYWNDLLDKK